MRDHERQDVAAIGHYREGKPAGLTSVLTHTAQVQEGASRFGWWLKNQAQRLLMSGRSKQRSSVLFPIKQAYLLMF